MHYLYMVPAKIDFRLMQANAEKRNYFHMAKKFKDLLNKGFSFYCILVNNFTNLFHLQSHLLEPYAIRESTGDVGRYLFCYLSYLLQSFCSALSSLLYGILTINIT